MNCDEKATKFAKIFQIHHNCIDFSDSEKKFSSDFYAFNKDILTLPSLGVCLKTAEHII